MIDRIEIRGYRRLADFSLELRPLCVLIGANGCGKSSLLDACSLLSAAAGGQLRARLSELGGLHACLTRDNAQRLSIAVDYSASSYHQLLEGLMARPITGTTFRYGLAVEPLGIDYRIVDESLAETGTVADAASQQPLRFEVRNGGQDRPSWMRNPREAALAQCPGGDADFHFMRESFRAMAHYRPIDVGPRALVRQPQQIQPARTPGADGEELVSCLFQLRETDRPRFQALEDTLSAAFPEFERLEFPPVATGALALGWKERCTNRPFFMNELADGMLRFLWLAALLHGADASSLTLIDEPETGLHPELLQLLAELLREASQRTQLIVTTHSDRLVRFLQPTEVAAIGLSEDGTAQANWADQFDLEPWLQEYSLDELWRMGRIGGRM